MNRDNVEEVKQVNYLKHINDMIRVSHETDLLSTEALKLQPPLTALEREEVEDQVKKRKQIIAGLHVEIRELQSLLSESP